MSHWIWALVVFGCLVWYTLVSIYVAIKGAVDIKSMLAHLRDGATEENER